MGEKWLPSALALELGNRAPDWVQLTLIPKDENVLRVTASTEMSRAWLEGCCVGFDLCFARAGGNPDAV
ncbi:MAG: hypothetical protein AAGD07_00615 [Planctomycetota bacterium]